MIARLRPLWLFRSFVSFVGFIVIGAESVEATNLATLTRRDADNTILAFLLNLDIYSVVSATDKSYGSNRLMFSGVPMTASETELVWVWKNGTADLGNGAIKGVKRTYVLDRNTLEMRLNVDINSKNYLFHYRCFLARRAL